MINQTNQELTFEQESNQIHGLMQTIKSIRSLMSDFDVPKDSHISIQVLNNHSLYGTNQDVIKHMAKVSTLEIHTQEIHPEKTITQVVNPNVTIFLHLDQNIDIEAEKEKMNQEINKS